MISTKRRNYPIECWLTSDATLTDRAVASKQCFAASAQSLLGAVTLIPPQRTEVHLPASCLFRFTLKCLSAFGKEYSIWRP